MGLWADTIAQWLTLPPHSEKLVGLIPETETFLCAGCMFSLCLHGFPPPTVSRTSKTCM